MVAVVEVVVLVADSSDEEPERACSVRAKLLWTEASEGSSDDEAFEVSPEATPCAQHDPVTSSPAADPPAPLGQ